MAILKIKDDDGERTLELDKPQMTVGRSSENEIPVKSNQSSRRHCQIERVDAGFKLVDLESRNGTRVNGKFVNQHLLLHGDKIMIGDAVLEYDDPTAVPAPSEPTARTIPVQSPDEMQKIAADQLRAKGLSEQAAQLRAGGAPRRRPGSTVTSLSDEEKETLVAKQTEARWIKYVGIGAGVLVGALVIYIVISVVTKVPQEKKDGEAFYNKAVEVKERDPGLALQYINQIPRAAGDWYDRGQALKEELTAKTHVELTGAAKEMQDEYALVDDFIHKHPDRPDEILAKLKDFEAKYAQTMDPKFQRWIQFNRNAALQTKQARNTRDIDGLKTKVAELSADRRYAEALTILKNARTKHINDVEMTGTIDTMTTALIDEALKHFVSEDTQAQEALKAGKSDDAHAIYGKLLAGFQSGSLDHPEFKDTVKAIRTRLGMQGE